MTSKLRILDCTLRDGGYINDWQFGNQNIKDVLSSLTKANIDIIECGFLEDSVYNQERSFYSDVDQIEKLLPNERGDTEYVAMARFGFLDINNLKDYDGKSINGIRVTFHEDEAEEAINYCEKIQEKGYKVYVQPVGTTSYTDNTLLKIIEVANRIKPYAFYIVDTLGLMKRNDLLRMFYLIDNNLDKDIIIGFHSHNNLQLSFSNAQELVDIHTRRTILIDSSVYGMGRGAGNLNTELIAQHLNHTKDKNYRIDYLLEIIDDTINRLLENYSWGYTVPYYLAAINNCHPNYATYLMDRKTLTVKSISSILNNITQDKRELYDGEYISELYTQYQKHHIYDSEDLLELKNILKDREILILAPGNSIKRNLNRIEQFINRNNPIVISINFDGGYISPNYCFFSNDKRYQKYINLYRNKKREFRTIFTSNVKTANNFDYRVNYSDYLNSQPLVNDNATLMLISLLYKLEVKVINIAGFDGFHPNTPENYVGNELETNLEEETLLEMNRQISIVVEEFSSKMNLSFLTESLYRESRVLINR
ncbi:aldolase catalytic domain-containing protein [Paenibacillus motobuensis]|uniref:Aldolase catalytic domain-containing protein n=1 Tax=Paenibacillus motobuensis TaxID=295324 RepID=A0ABN0Y1P5_9BACL